MAERSGQAEVRKVEFSAVGKTCKAMQFTVIPLLVMFITDCSTVTYNIYHLLLYRHL